jgi:hypothetical protein
MPGLKRSSGPSNQSILGFDPMVDLERAGVKLSPGVQGRGRCSARGIPHSVGKFLFQNLANHKPNQEYGLNTNIGFHKQKAGGGNRTRIISLEG